MNQPDELGLRTSSMATYERDENDPIPDEYMCGLCYDALRAPVRLPCRHLFCHSCLAKLHSSSCPFCRKQFNPAAMRIDMELASRCDMLYVCCPFRDEGCSFRGSRSAYWEYHEGKCPHQVSYVRSGYYWLYRSDIPGNVRPNSGDLMLKLIDGKTDVFTVDGLAPYWGIGTLRGKRAVVHWQGPDDVSGRTVLTFHSDGSFDGEAKGVGGDGFSLITDWTYKAVRVASTREERIDELIAIIENAPIGSPDAVARESTFLDLLKEARKKMQLEAAAVNLQ